MTLLDILQYPDPRLALKSSPVEIDEIKTPEVQQLIADMIETMYAQGGVGLAAPQIGVLKRIIVIDVEKRVDANGAPIPRNPIVVINPRIVSASKAMIDTPEGCLSIRGYTDHILRSAMVTVEYRNIDGEPGTSIAEGILSVAFQHEIDHLEGVVFLDRLSRLKKDILNKKLKKAGAAARIR